MTISNWAQPGGGIDGAHILTPMPYLMTAGKITKTPGGVPMQILARLNVQGQGIVVANTHKDLAVGLDATPLKERFGQPEGLGQGRECRRDVPGRHT